MTKEIEVNGVRYELEISAREIKGSQYIGPQPDSKLEEISNYVKGKLETLLDMADYAIEQREYEADCTKDEEDKSEILGGADEWTKAADELRAFLDN